MTYSERTSRGEIFGQPAMADNPPGHFPYRLFKGRDCDYVLYVKIAGQWFDLYFDL